MPDVVSVMRIGEDRYRVMVMVFPDLLVTTECDGFGLIDIIRRYIHGEAD